MRILAAIPHYFEAAAAGGRHGSTRDPGPRVEALTACVAALRQHFGGPQVVIDIAGRRGRPANARLAASRLDIIVCTTKGRHLLPEIPLAGEAFRHHPTDADPPYLGYECHAALYERLGDYDYYCYLEDDLIVRDPWLFAKLGWFARLAGPGALLMPNRYEVARDGVAWKAYIDGDLAPGVAGRFQDVAIEPTRAGPYLGLDVTFRRPTNPHSGCFFLDSSQLHAWSARPDFLERGAQFVGPLESAATLGPMRAFRIYKPTPEFASFLEVEHAGTGFIANLRRPGATAGPA